MSNPKLEESLFKAIEEDNYKKVNYILALKCNVNVSKKGKRPLCFAKSRKVAEVLVNGGCDINDRASNLWSPLMFMLKEKRHDVASFLMEKGCNVNHRNHLGVSALTLAVINDDIEMAKMLISKRADIDNVDEENGAIIIQAKSIEMTKLLLENGGNVNVDAYDSEYGSLPIWVYAKNDEEADLFIKYGADIYDEDVAKRKELWEQRNALMVAKSPKFVKMIIEYGCDVNAKDELGKTPLMYAETLEVAKLLVEAGADINAKNEYGNSLLHYKRDIEVVRFFIKNGADVNAKNKNGFTPLMGAVERGEVELVKELIKNGANVNDVDNVGYSALHYVNNPEIAKILIENGANVNAKSNNNNTPIMCVDNYECAKILVENGADIKEKNNSGENAIMFAVVKGNHELVEFLIDKGADVWGNYNGKSLLNVAKDEKMYEILDNARKRDLLLLQKKQPTKE